MFDRETAAIARNTPPTDSLQSFNERRREPRFPCEAIPARVQTDSGSISAHAMDISRSGIRLEVATSLTSPSEVTIYFNNIVAVGEVRYCRRNPKGLFDVGIQLQDVITSA